MKTSSVGSKPTKIILDVSSSGVNACLTNGRPVGHYQRKIFFDRKPDINYLLNFLSRAITGLLTELNPSTFTDKAELHLFLSWPLAIGKVKISKNEFDQDISLTNKKIAELSTLISGKFINGPAIFSGVANDENRLLESVVMEIKANGYVLPQATGQKTKNLQLSYYYSLGSKILLARLEKIIRQHYPQMPLFFHTLPLVVYRTISELVDGNHSSLAICLGGEMTDLYLISQGVLLESISFPFGRNNLIRQIAEQFASVNVDILSKLELYRQGRLGTEATAKLLAVIEQVKKSWLDYLISTTELMEDTTFIPKHVFVFAEDEIDEIFMDFLTDPRLAKFSLDGRGMIVHSALDELFDHIKKIHPTNKETPDLVWPRQVFLLGEMLFLNNWHLV